MFLAGFEKKKIVEFILFVRYRKYKTEYPFICCKNLIICFAATIEMNFTSKRRKNKNLFLKRVFLTYAQ